MMFEIGIFCVILFAIGYWATLFVMGRREDVLHGEFVEGERELIAVPEAAPMPFPGPKPASRPSSAASVEPAPAPVVASEAVAQAARPDPPAPVAITKPAPTPPPPVMMADPVPQHRPAPARQPVAAAPVNNERLQSLLASIKQELKNAAQI